MFGGGDAGLGSALERIERREVPDMKQSRARGFSMKDNSASCERSGRRFSGGLFARSQDAYLHTSNRYRHHIKFH
jgi:hypothetical protein